MDIYRSNTHAHSIGWNTWHFEWCTKYRYKLFRNGYINNLCLIAIQEAAKRHNIGIVDAEVDVDHIHIIASLPMDMAPVNALHLVKGFSSKLILTLVPNFRKRYPKGKLWSPGKFAASVGHITLENAKKYLEDHHAKASLRGVTWQNSCAWHQQGFNYSRACNFKKPYICSGSAGFRIL